ncbi:MAG: ATP-binding protein [Patescibacteria group bacterium]
MFSLFSGLSIYRKILASFFILGLLATFMALLGFFNLNQINKAIESLTPHVEEASYLSDINTALGAFDKDLERYATIGGEENKDRLLGNLDKARKITIESFIDSSDSQIAYKLLLARDLLKGLSQSTTELITLKEEFKTSGINEKIVQIYSLLQSLNSDYADIEQILNNRFNSSLENQRQSVLLATKQFAAIVFSIVVLGVFLSFLLSRAITRPILKLRDTANTLASGDYRIRTDTTSKDEIGELAISFNQMGENLLIYTTKLEGEVAKRTEELHQKVEEVNVKNELLKKREEELTLVNERLSELDKVKSEFISVAAHQLRTPLSAIKWILSLLIDEESKNLTSEQRSLIMKGYESNERIIKLINEMLVVTRIESGKVQYNFTLIHIEDLIDSVLIDFAGQAHARKMNIVFEKPGSPLPYINADPEKIRGVVQNLVENSMRYTNDGGDIAVSAVIDGSTPLTINPEQSRRIENNFVKVSVRDNGIGIPIHQQSSIFNKFFRADNATKYQADGSGLGLFVAKSTVEKHGGQIGFKSVMDKGTTFYFTLPFADTAAVSSA